VAAIVYRWKVNAPGSPEVDGKILFLPLEVVQSLAVLDPTRHIHIGELDYHISDYRVVVELDPLSVGVVSASELTLVAHLPTDAVAALPINTAATGDVPLISAIPGKRIVVVGLWLNVGGDAIYTFKSDGVALTGVMSQGNRSHVGLFPPKGFLFRTNVGQPLVLNKGNNQQLSGFIYWNAV